MEEKPQRSPEEQILVDVRVMLAASFFDALQKVEAAEDLHLPEHFRSGEVGKLTDEISTKKNIREIMEATFKEFGTFYKESKNIQGTLMVRRLLN